MLEKTESLIKSAESKKAANEWGLARVDYLEAYDLLKKADKSDAKIQKYTAFVNLHDDIYLLYTDYYVF